jgi:hypothetical protein
MRHRLPAGGSVLERRLSSYLGRDSDCGFLAVLRALILPWAAGTAVVFGCAAHQRRAAAPAVSPPQPGWTPVACDAAVPAALCLLTLPKQPRGI